MCGGEISWCPECWRRKTGLRHIFAGRSGYTTARVRGRDVFVPEDRQCDVLALELAMDACPVRLDLTDTRFFFASTPLDETPNSENSKANRIETMKGPAESGQI